MGDLWLWQTVEGVEYRGHLLEMQTVTHYENLISSIILHVARRGGLLQDSTSESSRYVGNVDVDNSFTSSKFFYCLQGSQIASFEWKVIWFHHVNSANVTRMGVKDPFVVVHSIAYLIRKTNLVEVIF